MRALCVIAASLLLTACGTSCPDACNKLYSDVECNLSVGGLTQEEALRECTDMCEDAMVQTGEMGDYNPERPGSGTGIELENQTQAAAWMDCIEARTCEDISIGYCPPRI